MRKLIVDGLEFRCCREGSGLRHRIGLVLRLGAMILLAAVSSRANAQTFTNLLSFDGTNGAGPEGSLTLCGSTLYGMTRNSGAQYEGNVFSISVTRGNPYKPVPEF